LRATVVCCTGGHTSFGRRCFLSLYTRSKAGVQVRGGTGHMARGLHLRAARDAFIVRCAHRLAPL